MICRACAANAVKLIDDAPPESTDVDGPRAPWDDLTDADILSRLPDVAEAGEADLLFAEIPVSGSPLNSAHA